MNKKFWSREKAVFLSVKLGISSGQEHIVRENRVESTNSRRGVQVPAGPFQAFFKEKRGGIRVIFDREPKFSQYHDGTDSVVAQIRCHFMSRLLN